MGLIDYVEKQASKKGPPCMVAALPDKVRAELEAAPPLAFHTTIRAWLKEDHQIAVSTATISRHRRGECKCR